MSNEKIKNERYTISGGINTKSSPYLTDPSQQLALTNFDFQTPGSVQQRWGSTHYIGQQFSGPITSLYEFQRTDGFSCVITSHSGGIWYGATTGTYQGLSLGVLGQTLVTGGRFSFVTNTLPAGNATVLPIGLWYSNDLRSPIGNSFTNIITPVTMGENKLDFVTFQNYCFMADGNKYLKFDGTNFTRVGLPYPNAALASATTNSAAAGTTVGFPATGVSGIFGFYVSYVNSAGQESQIWPIGIYDNAAAATYGGSFVQVWADVNTPLGYGISAINVYSYFAGPSFNIQTMWSVDYGLIASYPASGSTITRIPFGTTVGGFSMMFANGFPLPDPAVNDNFTFGTTLVRNGFGTISGVQVLPYFPSYLEIYKNRIFAAGFSAALSTVNYSDLAKPEAYPLENSFEMRTNDGDIISCMRAYQTRLYLFKRDSFQALYGDDPSNFYLQEISQSYGCVNNRSAVIYDDLLVFLDRKGAMLYNGSSLNYLGDKIQPIFDTMFYNVALDTATMTHDKLRNQILIGMPVNGVSFNNLTTVYNYNTAGWTTYDGYIPTVYTTIKGYNNTKNAFFGDNLGFINWFGSSFTTDSGVACTLRLKSSYFHDLGESTEKQFRRIYMNILPQGITYLFNINFYQDYGASIVQSISYAQFEFQDRFEYGIPAKALSFELLCVSPDSLLRIDGYTIESRMQRRV